MTEQLALGRGGSKPPSVGGASKRLLPPSVGGASKRRLPPSVGGAPRPTLCFRGRLVYARSISGVEDVCREIRDTRGASALGFDIEWRVTFERGRAPNPVAVLQLATSDSAFVIQLSALATVPACLVDLLADPSVALVGVGARGDARRLEQDYATTIGVRDGLGVGTGVGAGDGFAVGADEGCAVGIDVGAAEGTVVGIDVGI